MTDDDPRVVLPSLLRRLYARLRARGLAPGLAREQAAVLAAELLACEADLCRQVLADLPLDGVRRPL